ncbi:MAG: helix-turn-helix transcriptional regulator [Prolixibacteraceae bacterium]|nr:helix-turn-helix transcriptional regulator [Prolixibacteraceae bacterium]
MAKEEFPDESLEKAAYMLKSIAHPVRVSILCLLKNSEKLTVTQIYSQLEIGQSKASHHLGILKVNDVLGSSREGKNTVYFLKHKSLGKIIDCIRECTCSS